MTTERIRLTEVPVAGNSGLAWNRLHAEREEIREAMLNDEGRTDRKTAVWHLGLLQSRLRDIDRSIDRLMSGSYGICSKCGHAIEDTLLDLDATSPYCDGCNESIGFADKKFRRMN